jgi:hypothetical protein
MTTAAAAAMYEAQHIAQWNGAGKEVFNPHNKSVDDLPFIWGFNNGGRPGFMDAVLVSQDGHWMGGHCCSSESYMPHDLGVLKGSRPDRHESFRKHYPDGYRMEFVGYDDYEGNESLKTACLTAKARVDDLMQKARASA